MPINYKQYPQDWKERRERILKRAGHCCELCSVRNHSWIIRSGDRYTLADAMSPGSVYVVLTIAHLDHDRENENVPDERLRALCQRCHLNYDRPRNIAKRLGKQGDSVNSSS